MIDLGTVVSGQWSVFSKSRKANLWCAVRTLLVFLSRDSRGRLSYMTSLKRKGRFENRPYKTLDRVR